MLNNTWEAVNKSEGYRMAYTLLSSMEGLVKNIRINSNHTFNTANVELQLCSDQNKSSCNRSVFGVGVNLQPSSGTVKVLGLKHMAEKLKPFKKEEEQENPNIVVSVQQHGSAASRGHLSSLRP